MASGSGGGVNVYAPPSRRRGSAAAGVALDNEPHKRGMTVFQVQDFHDIIKEELDGYCRDHLVDAGFRHVPRSEARRNRDLRQFHPMKANMHAVVLLHIKPATLAHRCSYAHMLNREKPLQASYFISHSWAELFSDFVDTVIRRLEKTDVVWICSFALDQNANITAQLGENLEESPFARALKQAKGVIVLMDRTADPLTRVWCVYEIHLAQQCGKYVDLCFPDSTLKTAIAVQKMAQQLDVRCCRASNMEDHARIMRAIDGREDDVNTNVCLIANGIVNRIADVLDCRSPQQDRVGRAEEEEERRRHTEHPIEWTVAKTDLVEAGSDRGSGARMDLKYFACYRSGWLMLGHSPSGRSMLLVKKGEFVKQATGWERVWWDKGSGNKHDYDIFVPTHRDPSYKALGVFCNFRVHDHAKPNHLLGWAAVVHISCLERASLGQRDWRDAGSRASKDIELKEVREVGTMWPSIHEMFNPGPALRIKGVSISDAPAP